MRRSIICRRLCHTSESALGLCTDLGIEGVFFLFFLKKHLEHLREKWTDGLDFTHAGTNPGQDDNNGLALMSAVVEDITAEAALVEEENPLNFIPLNNKNPITLNALGITVRDQTGQIVQYDSTSSNETECQYVYLVFDVERPKFNMRDLANLLRPRQDEVVAQQTEITKDILGK